MLKNSRCDELAKNGLAAAKNNLELAASILEETASCFDSSGNRKKAGQYLTLAGDFHMDLNDLEKAASCYGKAILRYLMIEDFDTAQLLLKKGKEYGFTSSFHQFSIAQDAIERKFATTQDNQLKKTDEKEVQEEVFDIDIVPLESEHTIVSIKFDEIHENDEVIQDTKDYIIPQLQESKTKLDTFNVMTAVSKATRQKKKTNFQANAVFRDKKGETRLTEPFTTLNRGKRTNKELKIVDLINEDNIELEKENEQFLMDFSEPDILDLNYTARTEFINEYEEELADIELVDTIPFQWQVIDVKSDFNLETKEPTQTGMVFTWKADKIDPGSKLAVEYVLRKRVERSILLRRETQVSVITTYHSIKQDLQANLDFVNTTGKIYNEILIEDVIPPELIVTDFKSSQNLKPYTIPTHDSTLFRWTFNTFNPGDNFQILYKFREKPITRHYIEEIITNTGLIKIEKISQPLHDSITYDYIWYYSIKNSSDNKFILTDRIPPEFDIELIDPIYLKPSLKKEKNQKILKWNFLDKKEHHSFIILRIRGSESFTPVGPTIIVPGKEELFLLERNSISEKKLIDLRKLKKIEETE
ncbi:hypothetical protein [Candidatus Hodarchaeum mangrovi]